MTRTRVAPDLQAVMQKSASGHFTIIEWSRARYQISALLAVVRAAENMFDPERRGSPDLRGEWRRLDRALSRLDRASGGDK
jgi:hypothetical protein